MLVAIMADRLTWTARYAFLAHCNLLGCRRLIENINDIARIIAIEDRRRDLATDGAIEAENINIKSAGNVLGVAVSEFSHKRNAVPFGFTDVLGCAGCGVAQRIIDAALKKRESFAS
jgi:hypothetical protein